MDAARKWQMADFIFQENGPLGLAVENKDWCVAPGEKVTISLMVANRSAAEIFVELSVQGVPMDWSVLDTQVMRLGPRETRKASLTIAPPPYPLSRASQLNVSLSAALQSQPDMVVRVEKTLTLAVVSQFTASLPVPSIIANQVASISVTNQGNSRETYAISFQDPGGKLAFEQAQRLPASEAGKPQNLTQFVAVGESTTLTVQDGESGALEFRSRPRTEPLLGGEITYPFTVQVQSTTSGEKETLAGQVVSKALVPIWVVLLALLIILGLCLATFLIQGLGRQNASGTQTAAAGQNALATQLAGPTQTVLAYMTQTVANGAEDSDRDGLVNSDEARLGTNPILPDTDGDTLTDGDEVQRKTNPLDADTDADGVRDGDEVRAGTNPLNPDTDSDGLVDGRENRDCPHPLNPDSDGDGIIDGKDLDPCNPRNPSLTAIAPTQVLPTNPPPPVILPTVILPTPAIPTPLLPTLAPPTPELPTPALPTAVQPTAAPPTTVPPTAEEEVTPAPDQPSLSGQIVFASDRDGNAEIYALDMASSVQKRLTNDPAGDMQPALSPSGKQILFVTNRDGNNEIYLMDQEGQAPVNLSNNPADDQYPAWSPDGKWIAFTSDRDGNQEIYIMKKDGSEPRNLTQNSADDFQPTWFSSPGFLGSEEWVAFTTNRDGNMEIYRIHPDGTQETNLTRSIGNDYSAAGDGDMVAFVSDREGNPEIYIMKADGNSPENLTHYAGQDIDPAFGPSNDWIAFVSDRSGFLNLYTIQVNGGDVHNLTKTLAQDRHPSWR
jgi:Tol biopolymer transport system component